MNDLSHGADHLDAPRRRTKAPAEPDLGTLRGEEVSPTLGRGATKYTVQIVTSEADFDILEPEWTRLYEAFGTTPFQSFAWLRTWWRHYGETDRKSRLHLMVVSCDGVITAIAPLFDQRVSLLGVLPVRRLLAVGRDASGYLDLLVDEAHDAASIRAIATAFSRLRGEFDVLKVENMPSWSPWSDRLIGSLRECGLRVDKSIAVYCPRFQFAETWEETLALVPPATRGKMRRRQRQLVARHAAEVEFVTDLTNLDADFDEFVELHQQRWRRVGQLGAFDQQDLYHFFRDATRAMAVEGRLVLAFLRLDGHRRGAVMGVRHRDEFHFILSGQGEAGAASRYSPGLALHLWCMEALHGQGVRIYDFLPGTEPYRADLGAEAAPTWTVTSAGRPGGARTLAAACLS
jgi:CelD/BcsL family acetyltransferase involved in cellulose biosynthesis